MIYILFISLIILCLTYYLLFKRNILSPTVIACGVFIISVFFAMINVDTWKFTIAPITVVVILTALMTFGCGEFVTNLIFHTRKHRVKYIPPSQPIQSSKDIVILLCVVLLMLLIHFYNETVAIAKLAGYNGEGLMLSFAREATLNPSIRTRDRLAGQSTTILQSISYVFSFIFLYNAIFFNQYKKLRNIVNLFPVLIYLCFVVLSGGRTPFIQMIAVWFVIGGLFFMQKNEWSPNKTKRLVKIGLIGIAVFFALFIAAGSLKDSVFVTHAWESISFYTGLSIPSLDDYLLQPRPQSDHFGEETLSGIYYFLNRIGIHFPDNYVNYKHLEFVNFNGTMGNVYTVVRRLLHDYGYWGLYFLLFAFGFIYSFLFQLIKNKRSFLLIFYAFMFYPIVMVGIDEQLCSTWFSISWVWITLYMYIFWLLFVKNKIILGRSSAHNKKQHIVPNCI